MAATAAAAKGVAALVMALAAAVLAASVSKGFQVAALVAMAPVVAKTTCAISSSCLVDIRHGAFGVYGPMLFQYQSQLYKGMPGMHCSPAQCCAPTGSSTANPQQIKQEHHI